MNDLPPTLRSEFHAPAQVPFLEFGRGAGLCWENLGARVAVLGIDRPAPTYGTVMVPGMRTTYLVKTIGADVLLALNLADP